MDLNVPREAHSVTVTIPGTVDARLTPNSAKSVHWRTKSKLEKQLKDTTIQACQGAGLHLGHEFTPPLVLHYIIAWGKGRKRMDDDNIKASLKYVQDGIAEVLEINDKHITQGSVTQIRDDDKIGFIKVAIEQEAA